MNGVLVLLPWFVTMQTAVLLPALPPGSEVRLVSSDLIRVHAIGRVDEDRHLSFEGETPAPGAELRLLLFLPSADADAEAEAASGAASLAVRIDAEGRWTVDDGNEWRLLRELLAEQRIVARFPGEGDP